MSDPAERGEKRAFGEGREISGTFRGWWRERGSQLEKIKRSGVATRESFRSLEGVLLTSPRKRQLASFPAPPPLPPLPPRLVNNKLQSLSCSK